MVDKISPPCNLQEAITRIAILEERLRGDALERTRQAEEYRRRLDELNHAHAQRMARDADYVRLDVFVKAEDDLRDWRRKVEQELAGLRGRRDAYIGSLALGVALLSGAISFLNWLLP